MIFKRKIVFLIFLIFCYLFLIKLPVPAGFIGLDGKDYVGDKELKPSGISDIHLRKKIENSKTIEALTIKVIGGSTWVYPEAPGQRPMALIKNNNYLDIFLEPNSPYTRGIYLFTFTYTDGSLENDSIIP